MVHEYGIIYSDLLPDHLWILISLLRLYGHCPDVERGAYDASPNYDSVDLYVAGSDMGV